MGIGDKYCSHADDYSAKAGQGLAACGVPMGVAREMEIVWEELLDAFLNPDPETIYFLDRGTGDIFFVPIDHADEAFWQEIDNNSDQFLQIPGADYEQERLLLHEFIKSLPDDTLKQVLQRTFAGKSSYGKAEEILSFYPDELEAYLALKDEMLNNRIRSWLEEHDIYPPVGHF
jgi:hypothetical protein